MFLEKGREFSKIKNTILQEKKEVFYPEDKFLKMEITPADKVRYKENTKLAEAVFEEFNALINGDINLYSIEKRSEELLKNLNPEQQELIRKITKKIIEGNTSGIMFRDPDEESLQSKYLRNGKYQAIDYFHAGVSKKVSSTVKDSDIKLLPWGAVVVYINDEEAWKELYKIEDKKDALGFIKRYNFGGQVSYSKENHTYINEQFERTVYIKNYSEAKKSIKEVEKHELFHELYNNVLVEYQKNEYSDSLEKRIFDEIKNESIAYLFSQIWEYRISSMLPSSLNDRIEGLGDLFEYIYNDKIKKTLLKKYPEKFEMPYDIKEEDFSLISQEEKQKIEEKVRPFYREIGYFLREIIRLRYLESTKFEEATKILLTAQSFKEMKYKLSDLEKDKFVEPSIRINLKNIENDIDREGELNMAFSFINNAITFRLPIKNMDELIITLKNKKEELKNSTDKKDKDDVEDINYWLNYYKEKQQRIIEIK